MVSFQHLSCAAPRTPLCHRAAKLAWAAGPARGSSAGGTGLIGHLSFSPLLLLPRRGRQSPQSFGPCFPLLPPAPELRVVELRPRTARPGAVGPGRGGWPRREPVASGCPFAPWRPGGEGGGRGQAGAPSGPGGRLHQRGISVPLPRPRCPRPLPLPSTSCGAAASEKAERSGAAGPQPGRQRCAASPGPAGGSAAPGGRRVPGVPCGGASRSGSRAEHPFGFGLEI